MSNTWNNNYTLSKITYLFINIKLWSANVFTKWSTTKTKPIRKLAIKKQSSLIPHNLVVLVISDFTSKCADQQGKQHNHETVAINFDKASTTTLN